MESIKELLKSKEEFAKSLTERHKYVTQEFQDYGYRLAVKLGDTARASMYIRLAKQKERALLEQALSFAIDYPNAKDLRKIFLWKLKDLQIELDKKRGVVKPEKKKVVKKVPKEKKLHKDKIAKKTVKPKVEKPKKVTKAIAKEQNHKEENSDQQTLF